MQQQERIRRFVEKIWQWYAKNKRRLPWRDLAIADDAQRAYMILISEVMLQQTQVPRVQILFPCFLQKFPTIHDLAKASNRDVLIAWRGMGYNSRALRLRDAAKHICARAEQPLTLTLSRREREFPHSMKELLRIPGIGPYTAAAIRNFAFGIPTPCVDTNIERILTRVFRRGSMGRAQTRRWMEERAGEVLKIFLVAPHPTCRPKPRRRLDPLLHLRRGYGGQARGEGISAAQWHSALMDFGSLVCTKRKPLCSQCPLSQGICKSAFRVSSLDYARDDKRSEPGRIIAGRFIPNRIIRGKIVNLLRDHPRGLTLARIGREVCSDWSQERQPWLREILAKLQREKFVEERSGKRYTLPELTA